MGDNWVDKCLACQQGGDLLCCSSCPSAMHLECAGYGESWVLEGGAGCTGGPRPFASASARLPPRAAERLLPCLPLAPGHCSRRGGGPRHQGVEVLGLRQGQQRLPAPRHQGEPLASGGGTPPAAARLSAAGGHREFLGSRSSAAHSELRGATAHCPRPSPSPYPSPSSRRSRPSLRPSLLSNAAAAAGGGGRRGAGCLGRCV